MNIKVGIDIQEKESFPDFKKNKRFYQRVFSNREIDYCLSKTDYKQNFASKFCAKEAIIKLLGGRKKNYKDIEILNKKSGKPYVKILKKKTKISISTSHTGKNSIAVAILS